MATGKGSGFQVMVMGGHKATGTGSGFQNFGTRPAIRPYARSSRTHIHMG
jgi:hypothetical protein